jgi:hypothetical protein
VQDFFNKLIVKMPTSLRWVLFLPVAFLADLVAQSFYRFIFYFIPFHGVRPYTDELIWRFFAPMVFVVVGVKMAPRFWFYMACFLIAIKSAIALVNIYTLTYYLANGGSATAPAFVTNAPVWWSLLVQILFLGFAALIVAKDRNIRKEPTAANPVLDF